MLSTAKNRIKLLCGNMRIYCVDCNKRSISEHSLTELELKAVINGERSIRCPHCTVLNLITHKV